MQPTIEFHSSNPRLRFQAPALTLSGSSPAHLELIASPDPLPVWSGNLGPVSIRGSCRWADSDVWVLDFSLENYGDSPIEARAALPYIFYHFDQSSPARMFNPLFGGVLEESQIPLRISYPGQASFCMTAAAGIERSLAVGLFNQDQRHVVIRHIPAGADGHIRLVLERVWVGPGQTVQLPRMFIALGGHWSEAMRPYRDWFAEHFPRLHTRPAWLEQGEFVETRQAHCLVPFAPPQAAGGVWIFDNQGKTRTWEVVKAEIDTALTVAGQHGCIPLFYQFGWWQNMAEIQGLFMFDSLCGDYTAAHELAHKTVNYIHQRGARTYFYTNSISAGDETEIYKSHPELFARDPRGFPYYNEGYPMLMFCPGAPGMREYWDCILRYLLVDLGVDGIFLDQVCGGAPPVYCYDIAHQHDHPDTYGRDFLDLIDYIFHRARQLKPDCYVGGELVQDTRGVLLDEAHGYGYAGPRLPSSVDVSAAAPEYYIFTRYLCPQIFTRSVKSPLAQMNGAAGDHFDPFWKANRRIFEAGWSTCRTSPPSALAYLFGPLDEQAVLAVRAPAGVEQAVVDLPEQFTSLSSVPDGCQVVGPGQLVCNVGVDPSFYRLSSSFQKEED
jgi:hypothetical protein